MSWPQRLLVTSVGYVVAVVTLVWLAQRHTGWVLVVASLLLAAAALLVHFWLNHPDPPPFAWHLNVAEATMLVGVAFLGTWKATNLEGLGFIGLVTLFLGLGELMAALRSSPTPSANRLVAGLTIVGACAGSCSSPACCSSRPAPSGRWWHVWAPSWSHRSGWAC